MALHKIYSGTTTTDGTTTTGDYSAADNWVPIWLVASAYKWTASSSGTNEYYLELAAGGDPSIAAPGNVQENGANMTAGTLGSLAAGEYAYGDNDTLGYSTIYVCLSAEAAAVDPDGNADGYVTLTQIPVAGDDVTIPAGAAAISSGLDQSGIAIADFVVDGHAGAIGGNTEPLRIDPDSFDFAGSGAAYIDIGAAAIGPVIRRTAGATGSRRAGLYLTGSAITTLITLSGTSVAVAGLANQTSTIATWRNIGGAIVSGAGLSLTTLDSRGGSGLLRWTGAITTITQAGGQLRTEGAGTTTTHNLEGGTLTWTAGNVTTLNHKAGTLDAAQRTVAGTIATLTTANQTGKLIQKIGDLVTITTDGKPSDPYTRTYEL